MTDRLDFLYSKMNSSEFRDLLVHIHDSEAFFMLYNSAPENLKPIHSKDDYLTKILCSHVEKITDEKLFNEWFFDKDLKQFYDVEDTRKLTSKKPENKRLKLFLEEKDKPASMLEIIAALFYYRSKDKMKYQALLQEYRPKLENLNNKQFSERNKIAENLFYYFKQLSPHEAFKVEKEMHLDLLKINANSRKKAYFLNIENVDLEMFKQIWEKCPGKDINIKFSNFIGLFTSKNHYLSYTYRAGELGFMIDVLESSKNKENIYDKCHFLYNVAMEVIANKSPMKIDTLKTNFLYIVENLRDEKSKSDMQYMVEDNYFSDSNARDRQDQSSYLMNALIKNKDHLKRVINPLFYKLNKELGKTPTATPSSKSKI